MILLGFAAIVGVLTTQRIQRRLQPRGGRRAPTSSQSEVQLRLDYDAEPATRSSGRRARRPTSTTSPRCQNAVIRVVTLDGDGRSSTSQRALLRRRPRGRTQDVDGWRVESRRVPVAARRHGVVYVQYARRLSDVQATANRVKRLPRPRRARRRRAGAARRPGDRAPRDGADRRAHRRRRARSSARATRRCAIPHPEAERRGGRAGARRWRRCSRALDEARARDRGRARAPARVRRRRLARAAHAADLRAREPRAARGGARGRAARGRRLRAALVAPHAPARRRPAAARARRRGPRRRRTRRSTCPRSSPRRRRELEPVAGDHEISISAPARRRGRGRARRAAPARAEPAGERAAPHRSRHRGRGDGRAPQRRGRARRSRTTGPGIPPELRDKVFERFFRGAGDRSGLARPRPVDRARGRASSTSGSVRSRSRWTAAARASSCGSRHRARKPQVHASVAAECRGATCLTPLHSSSWCSRSAREEYALPIGSVHEIIRFTEPRTVASDVAVDPRRHRPARQDHPDLRPRRAHGARRPPTPSPARSSSSRPAPARSASWSTRSRRS